MAGKHTRYVSLMKAFGKSVRFYRNKLGFSQESLADRAQLDRSYMSQIERGIKNATLNSIWRISQALEVKPSDLLSLTEQIEASGETTSKTVGASRSPGASRSAYARQETSARAAGRSVVLVVDDDEDICQAVESILREAGFSTRQANCGLDAMRLLAEEKVDAVVSDIRMANGNGLELLDAVRRHFPDMPLFFITGYDDLSHEDAIRRGASGIFNKPFDLSTFVSTLRTSLDGVRAEEA